MDWYSYWIAKHVLVQDFCFHGSYHAGLYSGIGGLRWHSAAFLSTTRISFDVGN